MPDKNKATPDASTEQQQEKTEAPRAKTPLELVRERQAKMRGQQPTGRGSGENETAAPADAYKRRVHQRKSG